MTTIEIDFDVYKKLTSMRNSESVTYNDVLRNLLNLGPGTANSSFIKPSNNQGAWTTKGVTFPPSSNFRATHKGQTIYGHVENGALVVNGKRYDSPSAAAVAVTGNSVNGWIFWECKLPNSSSWKIIKSFRK
jgi:negative regulator of replication initiation